MNRSDFPDKIDKRWTLFLDRDGVLNTRIVDDYVRKWETWEWQPGVLPALASLANVFGKIIVITNQRGIALGLYNEQDLAEIHKNMKADVNAAGGRIDAIYHCPHDRDMGCLCRKPKAGMLLQAAKDDPEVDLKRALMVGDSISDMQAAAVVKVGGIFIGKMHRDLPANVLTALPDLSTVSRLFDGK